MRVQKRRESSLLVGSDAVVELRHFEHGLEEQGVDVHERRLEQVEAEHRGSACSRSGPVRSLSLTGRTRCRSQSSIAQRLASHRGSRVEGRGRRGTRRRRSCGRLGRVLRALGRSGVSVPPIRRERRTLIADADVPALFDRFGRGAEDEGRLRADGHGLGLSISRSVVTTHGGTLTAVPRPHGGLRITARFPPFDRHVRSRASTRAKSLAQALVWSGVDRSARGPSRLRACRTRVPKGTLVGVGGLPHPPAHAAGVN